MKKNKRLKKELLMYKKQIIIKLKDYSENYQNREELNNLIGDISLTNELIDVSNQIKNLDNSINQVLQFPIGSESDAFYNLLSNYHFAYNYRETIINEIIKHKFNQKKLIKVNQ